MIFSFPVALIILVVCITLIVAGTKKGSTLIAKKPKQITTITCEKTCGDVFKKLVKFGQGGTYKVEAMDESKKVIVFGENASAIHMGFFYPVYISSDENNKTLIEIGIQGKLKELKSVVSKNHEKFINNIKIMLIDTD